MKMDVDLPKKTAEQPLAGHYSFAVYAAMCLRMKTVYVWGGMGEILSPRSLRIKAEEYPTRFPPEKIRSLLEKADGSTRMFDCSGLIKAFLMSGFHGFRYDPEKDLDALELLRQSTASGPTETLPELEGICLYMPGHVGIYMGNGNVIEATNNPEFGDGVVQTKLSDRAWERWFCCRWIDYSDQPKK